MGLTSGLPSFIPRENTSVYVEQECRAPIERARHTLKKEGKYYHSWRADHSILKLIAASADRDYGGKTCLAFANPPTSPLKGDTHDTSLVCCPRFTRVNAACSVMLGRVGKVAGSEATTIKRWYAIPLFTYCHRKNARVRRKSTTYTNRRTRALFLR